MGTLLWAERISPERKRHSRWYALLPPTLPNPPPRLMHYRTLSRNYNSESLAFHSAQPQFIRNFLQHADEQSLRISRKLAKLSQLPSFRLQFGTLCTKPNSNSRQRTKKHDNCESVSVSSFQTNYRKCEQEILHKTSLF